MAYVVVRLAVDLALRSMELARVVYPRVEVEYPEYVWMLPTGLTHCNKLLMSEQFGEKGE